MKVETDVYEQAFSIEDRWGSKPRLSLTELEVTQPLCHQKPPSPSFFEYFEHLVHLAAFTMREQMSVCKCQGTVAAIHHIDYSKHNLATLVDRLLWTHQERNGHGPLQKWVVLCVSCCISACLCMLSQSQGLSTAGPVPAGFVVGSRGCACSHQLGSALLLMCACGAEQSMDNIKNQKRWNGFRFSNPWFMLVSFETQKKGALWAGISVRAVWFALIERWPRRSQKEWLVGEGNAFCSGWRDRCPARDLWLGLREHSLPSVLRATNSSLLYVKHKLYG